MIWTDSRAPVPGVRSRPGCWWQPVIRVHRKVIAWRSPYLWASREHAVWQAERALQAFYRKED